MAADGTADATAQAAAAHDDYEYSPLRIDGSTSRAAAAVMLSVRAEFTGWELARVLRFPDGSRRVTLRRKRGAAPLPAMSL